LLLKTAAIASPSELTLPADDFKAISLVSLLLSLHLLSALFFLT
jgi:hypothetical protein